MADYKYAGASIEDGVIRLSDGAIIPNSPGNRHWGEYQEYVASGGETDPWRTSEQTRSANAAAAKAEQVRQINTLVENDKRKALGLPPLATNEAEIEEHIQLLQADIDNPADDETYQPPLPPGVVPPSIKSLAVVVTREEGWQGNLGFRVVLEASSADYVPTNLALSVYSGAECTGYLYTTGAFQLDTEAGKYFAVCPPGQEPGDVDIHMGLLYGAAQLSCFTLAAGVQEKKIYAYEEV